MQKRLGYYLIYNGTPEIVYKKIHRYKYILLLDILITNKLCALFSMLEYNVKMEDVLLYIFENNIKLSTLEFILLEFISFDLVHRESMKDKGFKVLYNKLDKNNILIDYWLKKSQKIEISKIAESQKYYFDFV